MEIEIADRQAAVEVAEEEVRRVLRMALEMEERNGDLSVAIVGDVEMQELNARFTGREATTDVLAFGYDERPDFVEGEIIANGELAARQAGSRGHSAEGELMLYLVHGVLHLTGYDDGDPEQTRRMREREQFILGAAGYSVAF